MQRRRGDEVEEEILCRGEEETRSKRKFYAEAMRSRGR
jgi:hypothetical protein